MKRQDGEVTVRILLAEQTEDVNSILSLNFVGETVRVGTVFNTLLYRILYNIVDCSCFKLKNKNWADILFCHPVVMIFRLKFFV